MAYDEEEDDRVFDDAAAQVVALGNRLAEQYPEADLWDIASGILAGAVQFWLYARQPCGDPACEACAEVSTAAQRVAALIEETEEFAQDSEYYHTPNDTDVGRA